MIVCTYGSGATRGARRVAGCRTVVHRTACRPEGRLAVRSAGSAGRLVSAIPVRLARPGLDRQSISPAFRQRCPSGVSSTTMPAAARASRNSSLRAPVARPARLGACLEHGRQVRVKVLAAVVQDPQDRSPAHGWRPAARRASAVERPRAATRLLSSRTRSKAAARAAEMLRSSASADAKRRASRGQQVLQRRIVGAVLARSPPAPRRPWPAAPRRRRRGPGTLR